jgi:hypothetical protein
MFIWLSDVPENHGPTHIVPLSLTAGVPALPHGYLRSERPGFYEHELSGAGPAGTVVAYSTDTFHRGTEITAPRSARFSAHVSCRHADNIWTGRHAWGDRSFHPDWKPFRRASHRAATPGLRLPPTRPPLLDRRNHQPATSPVPRPRHTPVAAGAPVSSPHTARCTNRPWSAPCTASQVARLSRPAKYARCRGPYRPGRTRSGARSACPG